MTPLDSPRIPRDLEHKLNAEGYYLPENFAPSDVIYDFHQPFFGKGGWRGKSIANDATILGHEGDYIHTNVNWLVKRTNERHEAVAIYVHKRLKR
jgi:hypothetical protein